MLEKIEVKSLRENVFSLIGDRWMLVTAGDEEGCNTMTASWGGLGVLWGKNVATVYVRPQRYTRTFMEQGDYFTLSFFPEEYRPKLAFCGKVSGRDTDKIKESGLTVQYGVGSAPYFAQASLVLVCKKLYTQELAPDRFQSEDIAAFYPEKDYHQIYIGDIVEAYQA